MKPTRDYFWLIAGAAAALTTAALGLAGGPTIGETLPRPWGALALAVLIFAAFTGLHFRLQLVREMQARRDQLERSAAASRLILGAAADGRRWLRVVQENLEMVEDDAQRERERRLYLSGARANADKIEQAFERIEGNQQRLDAPSEPDA